MRNHVIDQIQKMAGVDERIMLLTGDLGFHVVEQFAEEYPDRYINCGIAEENMMSVAAGLALEGNLVFTYSIGNFPTLRCMEQIRNDICYHNANVKIIAVGGGFSYGSLGMTHHSTEDIAALRALPGMRVYAPADPAEALAVLRDACDTEGSCYIRLARGSDEVLHEEAFIEHVSELIPFYQSEDNCPEVVIITTGTILSEGIIACDILKHSGIKAQLYSCPQIKPIDVNGIQKVSQSSKLLVTLEEHNIIGGLGGAVSEVISGMGAHAPLVRLGLEDTYTEEVGSRQYLRNYYKIDGKSVAERVKEQLEDIVKK